jgi:tetratricopeptide (TPR) repeat protein
MIDKSAISKAAQKFISKGQIDKAIEEWEKLLKESPDGNVYNTVGDLYLKKGSQREAIEAFTKAANTFREDGFYLKAIALYKKILNISPSQTEALIALAELYAEKGLIGNANECFLTAAEHYINDGTTEKALEHYKRMLELSPSNKELTLKMAELFLKKGLKDKAIKGYLEIASGYLEKGEYEKAQEFYNRVIALNPQNAKSFIGLSKIAEHTANIQKAYEYLEKAMSFAGENEEVLYNYARLAIETNNIENARQVINKLLEIDSSNSRYKKLLGIIYLKEGLLDKAWLELIPFIDETLYTEGWREAVELLKNFKELEPMAVKYRLMNLYREKNDMKSLIYELKELAEIFERKGLLKDSFQTYKELLHLNPYDETVKEKIIALENSLGIKHKPLVTPTLQRQETKPSQKTLKEALAEADFYEQQGLKEEAIKVYENILSITPDNKDIIKKLEALKSAETPEEKLEIKLALSEGELSPHPTESEVMGVFDKFKKGIDEKIGDKDYESHYNLGIAYKEMGLLDDAIKEFQIASKDPKRVVQSSTMLAFCYMDKKLYSLAIKEFKRALEAISPADESYLGLKFDLAEAYEKNNELDSALKLYIEIHAQNPNFKDTKRKIENLKSIIAKEGKDKIKRKTDKRVSYI